MIGKLIMENYILKKRERIHYPEEKRRFIYHNRQLFKSIKEGCNLMDIKRSTFYYQVKDNRDKEQQEAFIKEKIQQISYQHPYYGYRRIKEQLKREKVVINHKWVLRMMRQMGVQAHLKCRYTSTNNSRHSNRVYPDLIKDFVTTGINQVWCSDSIYIGILSGFVYLAAMIDIYSRKIVGYTIGKTLSSEIALTALKMVIATRNVKSLIHHSDQGVQYTCQAYADLLREYGIRISMSAKGNLYDNAHVELFF
jgi:transposase InsO family protein